MHKISGNKWNKRICKWIASFLTIALLVNQSCFSVLAEEYEEYEYIEDVADTDTDTDANTNNEYDTESNTELDMDANESEITIPQYDEEIANEEDIISTTSVGDGFTYDKLMYEIISEDINNPQVMLVRYYNLENTTGSLDIPSTVSNGINEYKVVCIGEQAFRGCSGLTNITIPDSVTSIGESAFLECSGLKSITIPDSVTSIGDSAFSHCNSLESITIPNSVTSIDSQAFFSCGSLTSITIPDSVTSIGTWAFGSCTSLTNITISNSVTSIGASAFDACVSLTNITIPNSVTSIGASAFSSCINLTSITIPDSVTSIGSEAFYNCNSLTSITIPNSVTSIGERVFMYCSNLTNITIPNSVTSIGNSAFECCSSLTNITIPNSVTSIDKYSFYSCSSLSSVTLLNNNISIDWYAFMYCTQLKSLQIALSENITVTPTILGDNCFSQCPTDRSLTFLTEDGKTELNDSTTPTFADAVKAYNAVNDGGINDGYWYGWKLPEVSEVPDNEETFTITASAGAGGSVTPNGKVKVKSGDSQQFTITPEDGYRVSSIIVDGSEVLISEQVMYYSEAGSSDTGNTSAESNTIYYVFENVTDNHTLTAYFKAIDNDNNNNPDGSGDDNNPDDSGDDDPDDSDDDNNNDDSNSDGSSGNDTSDNSGDDNSGSNYTDNNNSSNVSSSNDTGINNPVAISDLSAINSSDDIENDNTSAPVSKDSEPKTGDTSHMEVYATIAMIAGLSYLLLYFADGKNGMTEEEKKEIVTALVNWAKKGKRLRKYAALAVIFLVLVYYHSIGKRTSEEWNAVYEK